MNRNCFYLSIFATFCLSSGISQAETTRPGSQEERIANSDWGGCPAITENSRINPKVVSQHPTLDAVYLEADTGTISKLGISEVQGNVILHQNQTFFNADSVEYNRQNNAVTAQGHVLLSTPQLQLQSNSIQYNLENQSGLINQAQYEIGSEGAHGKSQQIKKIDENILTLKDATFTTCPAPVDSWHISSSKIKLNNQTQIGTARNVKLHVGKVPVLYYPWFRFPLNNQRLSGFLTPSLRFQSDAGISLPYYFNLAPNYDATLTYSSLSGRGNEFNNKFRYLTPIHKGELEYEFIPQDKSFNNLKRDYFNLKHLTTLSDKTHIKLKAEGVSDKDYFDSKGISLETSTISALERRLEFSHKNNPWKFSAALEDYQVLDAEDAPYSKLPELKLRYQPEVAPKALNISIEADSTYFDRADSVTGNRTFVDLRLSKKWGTDAWYFKPSVGINHTLYNLTDNPDRNTFNRTLPTLTLDSGLFFDRDIQQGKYAQTLEPRFFYTYTPYTDQSALPIFDTALTDFSTTNQLFVENRFTGKDRIADTNQLTFAVTSRFQNREKGTELFKASIGQIFNFDDRRVTLPGGTIETARRSEMALELSGNLGDRFKVSALTLYNPDKNRPSVTELRLNYRDKDRRIANLSFRELDTELRQASASFAMPINDKWSVVASVDHDLLKDRNLEALAGVEYQDCCWKTRLVAKRYLTSDNVSYDTPVFLEFELKGLGNLGSSASRELKENIYGYDD